MLACIACSKQLDGGMDGGDTGAVRSPASKDAVKNLTAQIKDVALRLSGSNRYGKFVAAGSTADALPNSNSSSTNSTPKFHNALEELEEEEEEGKEWTSEFETGIMITLVSGKDGRNELRRIRFCREMFNKTRAQVWWAENHDKLLALYNVRTPVKHEDLLPRSLNEESDGMVQESAPGKDCPVALPAQNNLPVRPTEHACADGSDDLLSSSDNQSMKSAATNSCEEEEEADEEREWMEEDEPGVYITIRYSPLTGAREVKRVRFSREKFSEMQARLWWEDNRRRIQKQYIDSHNV